MKTVLYLLLMLRVGRCTVEQIFETKTVGVGADVTLTCPRKSSGSIFWMRLVSGDIPKVLGKTFSFERDPRITATEKPGKFVLHIKNTRQSDTAVYLCVKIHQQTFTLLKGADLKVGAPEPAITAAPPSDPVCPGDSVTQCSALSDSENKTCVCCLRAGLLQCLPSLNCSQENSAEEHEKNLEGCLYRFLKNVSSSDAGTYNCAVATCEERLSGNRSELNTEDTMWDSQRNQIVVSLLCAALAISLIVIAFLIYSVKKLKKESCGCCNASVALQTNAAAASGDQQIQQTDEDSLVYSAPIFTRRQASKEGTRDGKPEEEESIYTDVRALELD
ncbi:uncharacterized protein LOC144463831 [Epinephelus lanceolatus]